jgi:hypothetical protein
MARATFITALCVAALLAGCWAKQEPEPPSPQAQKQSGPTVTAPAGAAAKDETPRPAALLKISHAYPLKKYVAVERTVYEVMPYYTYVDFVAKNYVATLEEAVNRPDGFRWVSAYLADGWPVCVAEKKFIEDCFAHGIKLNLIDFSYSRFTEKGITIEEEHDHQLYEMKVYVKYTMEYIYPDGRVVKREERKVFTMEKRLDFGPPPKAGSPTFISVVITAIEDDTDPAGDVS